MDKNDQKEVLIIIGPTASGKSALALEQAAQQNGVVINADSMQIYDALPTLTAQPSQEEQEETPHRLYGILPPHERCDAIKWRSLALSEINKAHDKGQVPIVTGGTGFYISSLLHGLSPIPDVPDEIRQQTMALQEELGNPAFHEKLTEKDPVMGERLHPNDTQRLWRAWEVLEATGKSLSYWQSLPPENSECSAFQFIVTLYLPDKARLLQKIESRFDKMLDLGALDEVRELYDLVESGEVPEMALITHALGYHPLRDYLLDKMTRDEAIERSIIETRQYAKRQRTWFRNQIAAKDNINVTILSE